MKRKYTQLATVGSIVAGGLLAAAIANAAWNGYTNLSLSADADGNSKGNGTSYGNVVDGDLGTYWQPSGTSGSRISVKNMDAFDTVVIREINDATTSWRLTNHDTGEVLASGSSLSNEEVISGFGLQDIYKVNLIIDSAARSPRITEFELYNTGGGSGSSSSSNSSSSSSSSNDSSSSTGSSNSVVLQESTQAFCSIDGSVDSDHSGYTGSGFSNTDNESGSSIAWSVDAGATDTYTVTVRYASGGGDRPAEVFINGGSQGYLDMYDTGGWTNWTNSAQFSVNLTEGLNDIRFEATNSGGLPNIDSITVSGYDVAEGDCDGGSNSSSSSSSSGGSSSSSGNSGNITGATCQSTGNTSVSSTIYVSSGTYDGQCQTFNPTSALGDGSQDEGQDPAFRVENGATLKNVIIGNNGVDGIHVYNGGTLDNIHWTNVGEDAMTIKSPGSVTVRNVEGYNGEDKFIQVNAESDLHVENCIVDGMGKFLRQNGGTDFELNVTVDRCQLSNLGEGIFRSDSSNSTAFISNSRVHNAGETCIGDWQSCGSSNMTSY